MDLSEFERQELEGVLHKRKLAVALVWHGSWLNQVENGFGLLQRDVFAGGVFTCITGLHKKLIHYIRQYNANPKPLTRQYAESPCCTLCNSSVSAI